MKKKFKKTAATAIKTTASSKQSGGSPLPNDMERPAEAWTEEELDAKAAKAAEQARPLAKEERRNGFGYGRISAGLHAEILNGGKRVPDGEDTYARLVKKLAGLGIKKSPQRLRALAQAYELQVALGGEGKAPDLTPDHYVEVAKDGLTLDQKREILETAFEKKMAASGALRKFVMAKLGELGKEPERDAGYWRDWLEKSISRSQSILSEARMTVENRGIEIPSSTRDHLNFMAVFTYQFANQSRGPEDVK